LISNLDSEKLWSGRHCEDTVYDIGLDWWW
jgi:hypothetical protein